MMKRLLTLFLALMLMLMLALVPARAEEMPEGLYRIVLREETGDVTLGSGVLFGTSSMLLTAGACWAEGDLVAIGADGEHAITYRGSVMGTQLITLGLQTPGAGEPLTVTQGDRLLDYILYGVNAQGEFVAMDVHGSRTTAVDGRAEALLYAQEGLMPGAIMLVNDGGLACVSFWLAAEGEGAYGVVANVTLSSSFPSDGEHAEAWVLQGVTASYESGLITVDWSQAGGYVATEETVYTAYIIVTGNTYVTVNTADAGETSLSFPAMPGTEVMAWVVANNGDGEAALYPQTNADVAFVQVPVPEPYTFNGLTNLRCSVTPGDPGMDGVTTDFLPQEPLTREALSDRSRPIYFQTEDIYTCDAEDDAHTLMVTLYTPEGYCFYYASGYVFMPEYCASDLWVSDISEVFESYEKFCEDDLWPAGEYIMLYTIDGGEVARITFTLD